MEIGCGWKPVTPGTYDIDATNGRATNRRAGLGMHFIRLHAPQYPFPSDSDAIFFLSVEAVSASGNTEISFGAVPHDSRQQTGRVVGHAPGELGVSCYGPGYRTNARHRGWWAKDEKNVGDIMKEVDKGSKVILRWSAESRALSAEIDGHDQGSQVLPPGNFFLAATCDGVDVSVGRPMSFTLPARIVTLSWSPSDTLDKAQVQCSKLGGETVAVLDVDTSEKPTTVGVVREQIRRELFADSVQHPLLMLVTVDGQNLAEVADSASAQSVLAHGTDESGEVSLLTESGDNRDDLKLPDREKVGEPTDEDKKLSAELCDAMVLKANIQ